MQILYLSLPAMPCILVYAHMYMYMLSLIKVFLVAFTKFWSADLEVTARQIPNSQSRHDKYWVAAAAAAIGHQ